MGGLGVSLFQQVYGALVSDAIGSRAMYYETVKFDDAGNVDSVIKPALLQHADAPGMLLLEKHLDLQGKWVHPPHYQEVTEAASSWVMTKVKAKKWVREVRHGVCNSVDPGDEKNAADKLVDHHKSN